MFAFLQIKWIRYNIGQINRHLQMFSNINTCHWLCLVLLLKIVSICTRIRLWNIMRMRMSFIGQVCLHIRGICYSDRSSTDNKRTIYKYTNKQCTKWQKHNIWHRQLCAGLVCEKNLLLSPYLSLLPLLARTYLNNVWDLVLKALPLSVCLFKINHFMYTPIVSCFG